MLFSPHVGNYLFALRYDTKAFALESGCLAWLILVKFWDFTRVWDEVSQQDTFLP